VRGGRHKYISIGVNKHKITLFPSPEPSLFVPSFEAKYAGVSEKVLRGALRRI
jgi:hypothetical protein